MTWHIFNSDGHHIGTCDHEPNHEDLADRGETAYYYQHNGRGTLIIKDDAVAVIPPAPSRYHVLQDGEWILTSSADAQQLADAKTAKQAETNRAAQDFVYRVAQLDKVPAFEVDTWPLQQAEAELWSRDKTAETPILAQIAADRGVQLDDLREKALKKAREYATLSASVAGQRQAYIDQIKQAESLEAVEAIAVIYHLPTKPQQQDKEAV